MHKLFPSNLYNLIFSSAAAFRSVGGLPGRNTMCRLPLRSPPRVRGKDPERIKMYQTIRITPAYAGKRRPGPSQRFTRQDHPRVCGEKVGPVGCVSGWLGSPPRMQGKAEGKAEIARTLRITPAYAGKRIILHRDDAPSRDHPRVCGEKPAGCGHQQHYIGSPPRMRGKDRHRVAVAYGNRITPAYAGKRAGACARGASTRDHPRVCGEK